MDYDEYWKSKKGQQMGVANTFQEARAHWIASRMQEGSSVIDIGCGDGSVLLAIQRQKRVLATGADTSQFALDFLKTKSIDVFPVNLESPGAIGQIPIKDHALLLETLEHMPRPEEFLLQVLSRTHRSVFVSVPNTGYIHHRLRLLFGRFPLQWRVHPSEHLRFWTLTDFYWWLGQLGLGNRVSVHCYAGVPLLNHLWPSLFAQGIIAEIKAN